MLELPSARRTLATVPREPSVSHYLAGWTSATSVLLQRALRRGSSYQLQWREASVGGNLREVASVADSPVPAVHVDTHRGRLLLTRDENGVHNIYAVSLRDGSPTKITNNETPGVSFSGIQSLRANAIVFAREERKRDIWLVQRKPVN
jgi:hypothetical protein